MWNRRVLMWECEIRSALMWSDFNIHYINANNILRHRLLRRYVNINDWDVMQELIAEGGSASEREYFESVMDAWVNMWNKKN